jgi:glycosyltransferase involved in cell wall biosynthesis
MRVLEVVTVPFFTPRGTAFSSLERTRALSRLGHSVELLTYPLGEDVEIPNVRIHRSLGVPGLRGIPMGPSFGKLALDLLLAWKTLWWLVARGPWHLVHVHEEAAFWVTPLRALLRAPVLYDRHSSLTGQLASSGRGGPLARRIFAGLERHALRNADGVIVVCARLEAEARRIAPEVPIQRIENVPVDAGGQAPTEAAIADLRRRFGLEGRRVLLYTGSFGRNQGIELVIDALASIAESEPAVLLALVGGAHADFDRIRERVRERGAGERVVLAGVRPRSEMAAWMAAAEVLLSPRLEGSSMPLKIYSYLTAGRPIVATDVPAHTELLTPRSAELVAPRSGDIAAAVKRLLAEPERARALAAEARRLADERAAAADDDRRLASILERTLAAGGKSG